MWSLRCGVRYIEWLEDHNTLPKQKSYCFNRRVAEQMYNGGASVLRELKEARFFTLEEAKKICSRASWACKENYSYPLKIDAKQVKYKAQGVKGKLCTAEDSYIEKDKTYLDLID